MKVSINKFLENPEEVLKNDSCKGFYDWFCKDSALEKRAYQLLKKVKIVRDLGLVDGDKMYVWFKNNCPMIGGLYDDIRFSFLEDNPNRGNFCGGICPKSGHNVEDKAQIWWFDKDKNIQYLKAINWSTLKKQLKDSPSIVKEIKENFEKNAI